MTQPVDDNTPAVTDEPPPRPVWASKAPDSEWCPPAWDAVLRELVPGWPGLTSAPGSLDAETAQDRAGPWHVVAASRRGRLHAHRGEYREDAIAVRTFADGWCGAVADGAGSATWSRVGAAVATHTFCTRVATSSGAPAERATRAAHAVFDTLRALSERLDIAPRTLRTTLLAVAAIDTDILTLQVGDGGIVLVAHDGTISATQAGDAGEYSGDVMHFLPDDRTGERLADSLHVASATSVRAVLLATDGIEDPWYPLPRHAAMLVDSLERGVTDDVAAHVAAATSVQFAWRGRVIQHSAQDSATLAEWMTFEKRGENDDRSLLFARCSAANTTGAAPATTGDAPG